jgi:hypothetical protein
MKTDLSNTVELAAIIQNIEKAHKVNIKQDKDSNDITCQKLPGL